MRTYVWDAPTRLCHWLLVALVAAAYATAKVGGNAMVWHGRCGLAIVGLLTFRIVWGFIGSTYARFAQFVRGPATIRAYLHGTWQGHGHNPLGALSVIALLGVLSLQAVSGLFANDDIAFNGFLRALVDKETSDRLTSFHRLLQNLLLLLIALHLGAIAFYAIVKRHDLLRPMLTGWTTGSPADSARGGGGIALLVAGLAAAAAVWAASGALLPPPAPAPIGTPPPF